MAEIVAGIIDRLRTVSLHQWLIRLVVALVGAALIAVCTSVTGGVLAGATPVVTGVLLGAMLIWPESLASMAFLGICSVWWLIAWHGSLWATVPVAALLGLLHLFAALMTGPPHAVVRRAVLAFLARRVGLYVVAAIGAGSAVVVLSTLPTSQNVAWLAVVAVCAATLVATLVASSIAEAGQLPDDEFDDEPYVPEDLA
jgi:hypothetical protein